MSGSSRNEISVPTAYPMHGNHGFSWSINASSYLSHIHGGIVVSSIKVKCVLEKNKAHEQVQKVFDVRHAAVSEDIMLDNHIEPKDFKKSAKRGLKYAESFIISEMSDMFLSGDKKVLIMTSSFDEQPGTEFARELVTTIEFCFTDPALKSEMDKKIHKLIVSCYEKADDEFEDNTPIIGMICQDKDGLNIRRYSLDKHVRHMTDEELDLHYGEGFAVFNHRVTETLKSDSKGLIIFHGTPGTGKTNYIRMLIKELASSTKNVIYIPSSFVEMFMEPSFITFLQDWIVTMDNPTIILIEDAEALIESRDSGIRSQGIANLLNATDGILNDILGTQIILTFNIDLEFVDEALLRPERLLARKEFLDLDSAQAKKLLLHLGIDNFEPQGYMSLASIYAQKNKRSVIEHNAQKKKERIGF